MEIVFYTAAVIAIASTLMVITRLNAVHALLYLVVSLLSVALVFYTLGAPFAAALEVIIYAGAIVVLFVFVVMMLNLGEEAVAQERRWLAPQIWVGPSALLLVLLGELVYVLWSVPAVPAGSAVVSRAVGRLLFGPYLLAVEIASMLLLAALVTAYHLGRRETPEELQGREGEARAVPVPQAPLRHHTDPRKTSPRPQPATVSAPRSALREGESPT